MSKVTTWTIIDVEAKSQPKKHGEGEIDFLSITYKEPGFDGKIATKSKSMYEPFTDKAVYTTIASANKGDEIVLRMEKNDRGYWDVVALADATSPAPARNISAATPSVNSNGSRGTVSGSNYPTAEERAKTQNNIVRQSCLAQAVAFHSKQEVSVDDVLETASAFIDFINQVE